MPFTSETAKLLRGPGGRKKLDPVKKKAQEVARNFIEKNVQSILDTYLGLAAGQVVERETDDGEREFRLVVDPATTRHAIDKLIPDEQTEAQRAISINFVQYNNTVQLRPEAVPAAVLAGNGSGQAGGVSVAPASWQRQDGAELHDFEDVS